MWVVGAESRGGAGRMKRCRPCQISLTLAALLLGHALLAESQTGPQPERSLEAAEDRYERGLVALREGRLDDAERLLQAALGMQEALAPGSRARANSLNRLGSVALERGDLDLAQDYYQRALQIREQLQPQSLDVAASLNNLGVVALNRDELDHAWDFHRRALEIKEKLAPESLTVAASLGNLGMVASFRNDLELARVYMERDLKIKHKLAPESLGMAASLASLAEVAQQRDQLDQASAALEQSLLIKEKLVPESLTVAFTLNSLGVVARKRGELERASDFSQRARVIQEKLAPDSLALADTLDNLGAVALERGELEEAQAYFQGAYEIGAKLAPGGPSEPSILNSLGRVAWRRGALALAADYFDRSFEALEERVGRQGGAHHAKGSFRAEYGHCYRDAIELRLAMNRPAEAFALLERSRARSFLAMLAEKRLDLSTDLPPELEADRHAIATRHDRLQSRIWGLDPAKDGATIDALLGELVELRQQRDALASRIRQASPRLAALQYPETVGLQEARQALDPGTVMLSYSIGSSHSELFVVSREGGLEVHSLAIGEEALRREVELFREQIQEAKTDYPFAPSPRTFLEAAGRRLYQLLVAPAAARIEANARILFVPDGPLHLFPFGALIRQTAAQGSPAPGAQYLAAWKPFHTILSATVYARHTQRATDGKERSVLQLAAFGDPHYPARERRTATADQQLRSLLDRGLDLAPLPASRREVEEIAGLYPPPMSAVYLGDEATEERVKALGRNVRYLHFATHGFVDERLPLNSGLALTIRDVLREDGDNGLLQAWEIFESLRLEADLVVLSACSSGLGKEQGGEGLISLTRAFQYAGARSVVATLWSVEDRTTTEIMVRFYRHLKAGLSKDDALRAAQLDLIRGPITMADEHGQPRPFDASAPYYWAAFQLTGDWQ